MKNLTKSQEETVLLAKKLKKRSTFWSIYCLVGVVGVTSDYQLIRILGGLSIFLSIFNLLVVILCDYVIHRVNKYDEFQ